MNAGPVTNLHTNQNTLEEAPTYENTKSKGHSISSWKSVISPMLPSTLKH